MNRFIQASEINMKNTNPGSAIGFFGSLLILLLHIPVAFSMSIPLSLVNGKASFISANSLPNSAVSSYRVMFDSLQLAEKGLSEEAFNFAIRGYEYLKAKNRLANIHVLTIIDFSKSSAKKRLFVVDMKRNKILFHTLVAHGQNSGLEYATRFSNVPESLSSSLGFYVTGNTYMGKHGYSLVLSGVEKGINDNANSRDIVIHGADYVSDDVARSQGYIGRSWGCPAVSEKLNKPIIDKIKNGSCIFIYGKDKNYLAKSRIL